MGRLPAATSRRYAARPSRSGPSGDGRLAIRRSASRAFSRFPARRALRPVCRRPTAGAWSRAVRSGPSSPASISAMCPGDSEAGACSGSRCSAMARAGADELRGAVG